MYVPDTMQRLDEAAVERERKRTLLAADDEARDQFAEALKDGNEELVARLVKKYGLTTCEHCDRPATDLLVFYNPADEVRPELEGEALGAYSTTAVCDEEECRAMAMEEGFECPDCNRLFVTNHSWDFLAFKDNEAGELLCQACGAKRVEPIAIGTLCNALRLKDTSAFVRLNAMPGKECVWEEEYSGYPDFPGLTTTRQIAASIMEMQKEKGWKSDHLVYPLVSQGYQFSVVLALYA